MMRKLAVSWRAHPVGTRREVDVLVNPKKPRDIEALVAHDGHNPVDSVRFGVDSRGNLWFGCAGCCVHGDEHHGCLEENSHPIVYGVLRFTRMGWALQDLGPTNAWRDLFGLTRGRINKDVLDIVSKFKTWRNAFNGVELRLYWEIEEELRKRGKGQ